MTKSSLTVLFEDPFWIGLFEIKKKSLEFQDELKKLFH